MKQTARQFIAGVLGWQVRRLRARHNFKVVAVAGSVGKTSTKLAIASVLAKSFTVRYQSGNYNDLVSVPLVFFGEELPNIFNPLAWLAIFAKNEIKIRRRYLYQIAVIELGTDGPGQLKQFKDYLKVDVGVITAVTPEHMQFFADMDAVAREELSLGDFADKLLVNADLTAEKYLKSSRAITYGLKQSADYQLKSVNFSGDSASFSISKGPQLLLSSGHQKITEPQLYSILSAAAVADLLGAEPEQIDEGIRNIPPVSGRMQFLEGANGSTIIDDTYNASPEAMRAALDSLYRMRAGQKIAILGNMNELGHFSVPEHRAVGNYCDPKQLDLVVTIGPDANSYLAPAAKAKGCEVKTFDDPYSAGRFIKLLLKPGALVLAKGSQNKVFAEEAVKILLNDPADAIKLVRQSPRWQKIKQKNLRSS